MARVLFVCTHNAARSQMSRALFEAVAEGHEAEAAGTRPAERIHPRVIELMREIGIDISDRRPQKITREMAERADVVVTMGCGDECPYIPGKRYIDWDLPDPKELPLEEVRRIRDDIERRVRGLAAELGQQTEAGYCGTMAQENIGAWRSRVLEVRKGRPEVIALYSRLARLYEVWARLTESRPRRRVVELAAVRDGEAVLEVAIGTGAQLVAMARRNPSGRTVGIELADGMLAQARKRLDAAGLGVELRKADALQLPFEDETFDLVVNSYMLDLLPRDDIPRALAEFKRVLRLGGRLVLSNMTKGERRRHRFWDALYERGVVLTANCRGVLAAPVLRELGFADVRREYMAQMLFPTEIVTARKPSLS